MKDHNNYAEVVAANLGNDLLAKMLADADVKVHYNSSLKTAYADLKTRTVHLPFWNVSKVVSIHLRAHEVAHLLFTPYTDFHQCVTQEHPIIKELLKVRNGRIKTYVNIVEDCRIETMISLRYRGMSKIFAMSHQELFEGGLYGKVDANMFKSIANRVLLLSRLSLSVCRRTFSMHKDDLMWLKRMQATQTFDDVVRVACELLLAEIEDESDMMLDDLQAMMDQLGKVSDENLSEVKDKLEKKIKQEKQKQKKPDQESKSDDKDAQGSKNDEKTPEKESGEDAAGEEKSDQDASDNQDTGEGEEGDSEQESNETDASTKGEDSDEAGDESDEAGDGEGDDESGESEAADDESGDADADGSDNDEDAPDQKSDESGNDENTKKDNDSADSPEKSTPPPDLYDATSNNMNTVAPTCHATIYTMPKLPSSPSAYFDNIRKKMYF